MRVCGDCTLCCKLTAVPEIKKPINTWCQFCDINCACKIYDKRPPSCRKFRCGWYKDENIPDSFRPDRVNMLIEKINGYNIYLAFVDPDYPSAWENDSVLKMFTNFIKDGISVVISTGRGYPDGFLLSEGMTIKNVMGDLGFFAQKHLIKG